MRELRTAKIVANEVGMLRTSMRGAIVLVEGDTDSRLYRRFVLPTPHVRLTHCDGKPMLIEAMELLEDRDIRGVLAISDADFDRITGKHCRKDILRPEFHDAEMMIAHSESFKYVMSELYASEFSDAAFQATRDALLTTAAEIGAIRLWNEQNEVRLKFREVDPGGFLDANGKLSQEGYIAKLLEVSGVTSLALAEVMTVIDERPVAVADGEMACGHDFTSLLDADAAVKCDRDAYGQDAVEKMLRLALDPSAFSKTQLVRELMDWEERENLEVLDTGAVP